MKIKDLHSLLVHEMKDLYSAETQMIEALPKMAEAANDPQLKAAFKDHLKATKTHRDRLETIFKGLDYKPGGHHCKGMEGLIKEGQDMIDEDAPADVKDAGLISSSQRMEHYEIAGYGCARAFARMVGKNEIAQTLQKTLDEEGSTDELLTKLAEGSINKDAMDG